MSLRPVAGSTLRAASTATSVMPVIPTPSEFRPQIVALTACRDLADFKVPAGVDFLCLPFGATTPVALDTVLSPELRSELFDEIRTHKFINQEGDGQLLQFLRTNTFNLAKKRQGCMNCRLRLKISESSGYCTLSMTDSAGTRIACSRCSNSQLPCIVMGEGGLVLLPYGEEHRIGSSQYQLSYWIGRDGAALRGQLQCLPYPSRK
jgi:hypothetical protein